MIFCGDFMPLYFNTAQVPMAKRAFNDAEKLVSYHFRLSEDQFKKNIQVPIPMIGVGVNIGLLANILEARAKITGMGYSDSFFYDGLADISFTPFPFLNIHGGYRAMSLKIDNVSDIYAKMDFYGPYVGLAISF